MNGLTEVLQRSPANNSTEVQQRSPTNNTGITKPSGSNHLNIATYLGISSNTNFNGYKVCI